MNKFEEEIEKRYGSFELSHDKNKLITDDIKNFTSDVASKFAEWIADSKLHGYSKQLYEAMIRHKVKTTEELFEIFINNHYGK
jgi:hypothetical protein